MTISELRELAKHAAHRTAPAEYSVESVDAALSDGFKALAGSINDFLKNQYDIFNIVIENIDEVQPKKVIDAIGMFAEVKVVPQGQKAMFKKPLGRSRARKFLTQVGLSGVYETFRLDADTFELGGHAVGGACTVDFERFLDGAESLPELMNIITEGLTDAVFVEVHRALTSAFTNGAFPTANKVSVNAFDSSKMFDLITTVKAYGPEAVIFATPEFVGKMGADAIVPGFVYPAGSTTPSSGMPGVYHPQDIDAIHNTGYVSIFRGTPIVQIPQSFVDESNTKTWINPQFAYVLPAGKEKIVKVVLEGATQMWSATNRDQSIEVNAYKKMGCAIMTYHNWGIYQNLELDDTSESPYGY